MKWSLIFCWVWMKITCASSYYPLLFDLQLSPKMGAHLSLAANNLFFRGEEALIDATQVELEPWLTGTLRTLEMGVLVLPVNALISVTQHEFFGHCARAREFGRQCSISYETLPPPFDLGRAFSSIQYPHDKPPSSQELLFLDIGGVEAQMVLADTINWHTFKRKQLDPKLAAKSPEFTFKY